jgi:hypothetical protein
MELARQRLSIPIDSSKVELMQRLLPDTYGQEQSNDTKPSAQIETAKQTETAAQTETAGQNASEFGESARTEGERLYTEKDFQQLVALVQPQEKPRGRPFQVGNTFGRGRPRGSRPSCGTKILRSSKTSPSCPSRQEGAFSTTLRINL